MRRRQLLALSTLVITTTVAGVASGDAIGSRSCAATGSSTLVHKQDLRIYTKGNAVYACSTRYGRRVRLESGVNYITLYKRAGRATLAYAISDEGSLSPTSFGSRNLRTGKLLRRYLVPGSETYELPDQLIVKRDGSIAYIYTTDIGLHTETTWVGKDDKTGSHTLDSDCQLLCPSATVIDPTYLLRVGDTVHWRKDGIEESAPFY